MEDGLPEIRPGQSYLSGLCVLPDLSARPGLSDLPELFVLPGPADMGRSRAEGRIIGRDGGRVSRSVRRFSRPSMGQRRTTVAFPAGRTARCADGSFSASAVCCGWCTDCSIRFCRFLSVGITGRFCFVRLQGACRFVFVRPYRPACGLSVSSMAGRSGRCGKVRSGADCPWGCAGVCVSAPTGPSTSVARTCISASAGPVVRRADGSFSASAGRVARYACCPVPLRRDVLTARVRAFLLPIPFSRRPPAPEADGIASFFGSSAPPWAFRPGKHRIKFVFTSDFSYLCGN